MSIEKNSEYFINEKGNHIFGIAQDEEKSYSEKSKHKSDKDKAS